MNEKAGKLNDPTWEPTLEDFNIILKAAGDAVRAESVNLSLIRQKKAEGKQSHTDLSLDRN